ncbi:mediator of RNA polymerase II transcription subunit 25-like [Telopea speciosissima]|uniref:mediator of RNA polymerase II transcription subunit 25-like n=1 Tax=Telopea speciosissima TaxID=54955 RepID=UPI001CC3A049|nr:mediator of RNA polymerase II transcription subunit 25-like [Telopea speciosissima]
MAEKQLIVVVEGTAAMGPFWHTIVSDYLEKIIRRFCGNELAGQKLSGANFELALVVFNAHGSFSACLVQRSGWTKDMDVFLHWLSAIPFTGGGFFDAAICEGLSESLMMFSMAPIGSRTQKNLDGQRHCILVAVSNPYPLPTPAYRPPIQTMDQNDNIEVKTESCLADAETVVESFAQFSVSFSVISPKQLPKLRTIYNAGKRNPQAADPSADSLNNPQFLVLLSESFMEAHAALSHPGMTSLASNQSPVKMDTASIPAVSGTPSTSVPSVNESLMNRQPLPVGNIPTATGYSSLAISQALNNLQGDVSLGQSVPGMNQGNSSGTQMGQSGIGLNQNIMNNIGPSGVSSGARTMIPTPGMPPQVQSGMQPLRATNNSAADMPLPQQTSGTQPPQVRYIKVWEGVLAGLRRQGQSVFITNLEGYRNAAASVTLATDWPNLMQIVNLISQDHMNNKKYVSMADFLVFRALNLHGFLGQMQEKKLCAVIQLPSQTMLLSAPDKACHLIGMLFPGVR